VIRFLLVHCCFAVHVLSVAAVSAAGAGWRQHAVATDRDGTPLFAYTVASSLQESFDETALLLRDDRTGELWVLEDRISYTQREASLTIRDVRGDIYVRVAWPLEFSGRTRSEFIAHYRRNPGLLDLVRSVQTIETPGYSRTAREAEWNEAGNARAWKSELRRVMTPSLLEAIERMRPLTEHAQFLAYRSLFSRVLHAADAIDSKALVTDAAPDCRFDEAFGFECSDEQKLAITEAEKKGKPLVRY
jgi:hypothetical protein